MELIEKMNKYIESCEKKEEISRTLDMTIDLEYAIDMVKESNDRNKTVSLFNEEIKKQIQELIDGGIL